MGEQDVKKIRKNIWDDICRIKIGLKSIVGIVRGMIGSKYIILP